MTESWLQCPKCKHFSGDDWTQCEKFCPVEGSPHYNTKVEALYGPLGNISPDDIERG